VLVYDITN
jgi:GTPase SAR1 family protein